MRSSVHRRTQLGFLEFNGAGAVTNGNWDLTYQGGPTYVPPSDSMVGTGTDFGGTGGSDVFFRSSTNQLGYLEFNSAGAVTNGNWDLTYQGGPTYIPSSEIVVGTGVNFGGTGGSDVFFLSSTNQLGYLEFSGAGAVTNGNWNLTYQGGPTYIPSSEIVVGTGVNFGGTGGSDVFFRSSTNQLGYLEFNGAGAVTNGNWDLLAQRGPETIDATTRVIGTAQNFAGSGGADVFLLNGSGQMSYVGFNGTGTATTPTMTFVYPPNDATAAVGATTTVAGTAQNVFGSGEQDLFLREAGGQVHVWDVSGANELVWDLGLKNADGSLATIRPGDTVAGGGQNLLGQGGHDVRVTAANDQTHTWEFNNNGILLATG